MSDAIDIRITNKDEKIAYFVWMLLRLRLVLFISSIKRSKTRQKIGYGILVLFGLGLMAGAFAISWVILNFLNSPRLTQYIGDPTPFLSAVPTMIFFAAFVGILITSFGVLLQALYLANDMDFLLSAPVPIRAVFISKLLQAVLPNLGLISLFGLPVLFGLGASQQYNLLYFPLVVFILVCLALSAAGLASLLVMSIVRIFPARRVAEVLAFIGAILSFICGQSSQIFRFQNHNSQTVSINSLSKVNSPWFPLSWAGRSVVAIGSGHWLSGAFELLLISGLAGLIFWFSLVTAERLYYTGWATAQVASRKKRKQARVSTQSFPGFSVSPGIAHILPAPVRAIIRKDFSVLRRDLRNLSQLVTPLIFGVLYTFILLRDTQTVPNGESAGVENILASYGNVGIALFVGWMLLMRLALIAFSQEGKNYWLIKSSPVSTRSLLAAKFLVAFLPSSILGCIFLIGTSLFRQTNIGATLYGAIVIASTFAGLTGVLLSFGALGANFEWSDPRQMIRGKIGCFGSLAGMVFIALSAGLFYVPMVLGKFFHISFIGDAIIGISLGGVFNMISAYIPLQLVSQRVERLGEIG